MPDFLRAVRNFVAPFHDPRAWSLIGLCVGVVWLFDPVMAKTLVQWIFIFGALCG